MKTILIIEDEPAIARLIRDYLERAGFATIAASDGDAGLLRAKTDKPDLILLDLGLPRRDGLDVAREIRKHSDVPIIAVTARGDETDCIVGLELGADDYIVKPFSPRELVARVRAVLRRTEGPAVADDIIQAGPVEIDVARMRVTIDGRPVDLTATEFHLLATLARAPGRVFTRAHLLDSIHGVAVEAYERAIDTHVRNIRRKIEPAPETPRFLLTVHGVGYRFAEP